VAIVENRPLTKRASQYGECEKATRELLTSLAGANDDVLPRKLRNQSLASEGRVAEIIEQIAMVGIGSRPGKKENLAARRASVFRSEGRGGNAEFLQRINRNETVEPTERGRAGQRAGTTLSNVVLAGTSIPLSYRLKEVLHLGVFVFQL
jgi:hypothetical protein